MSVKHSAKLVKNLKSKQSTSVLGDAMSLLRQLPQQSFDLCIADPPYNMSKKRGLSWAFSKHVTMQETWDQFTKEDYVRFSYEWITQMCRILKPNGNLLVFGTFHNIYTLGTILQQLDRKVLNSIVWVKPNAQPNITCRMLTESTEQVIWACNNTNKHASGWTFNYSLAKELNGGKQMRNSWTIPLTPRSERVAGHPSQKPLSLIERMVLLFSRPGDWILDPFAGVGTTGAAAAKHGRSCLLIENQAHYVEAQRERFKKMGLGKSFSFIKEPAPSAQQLKRKKASPPSLAPEAPGLNLT